jgi:hypothetical protein
MTRLQAAPAEVIPIMLLKFHLKNLSAFAKSLFVPALPQIFRKIRQPHQDNRQSRNVRDMNPARKHARNDNRYKKPDDGSDKEHLELIQFNFLYSVDCLYRIVII